MEIYWLPNLLKRQFFVTRRLSTRYVFVSKTFCNALHYFESQTANVLKMGVLIAEGSQYAVDLHGHVMLLHSTRRVELMK